MTQQDTSQLKEKILSIMRRRGPSLPIHVSSEIKLSMLFTSAFLSELYSEKKVKISSMKVGTSPLYYIPGQEGSLENYSQYLRSKEREAFDLLKSHKILKDNELHPPIRVAIRSIKDFAIPFKDSETDELWWRYINVPDDEAYNLFNKIESKDSVPISIVKEEIKPESFTVIEIKKEPEVIQESVQEQPLFLTPQISQDKPIDIFTPEITNQSNAPLPEKIIEIEKPLKEITHHQKKLKVKSKKFSRNKSSKTQNEKFFNKIKEYLSDNKIEIEDIIGITQDKLTLKVKENKKVYLIVAYNKKKITEKEIIEASKKAKDEDVSFSILSLGEPQKSLLNLIEAIKGINEIKRVE
ncbi:hypothetical protein COU57_05835 [Candidatus Pacearchaeota archaeon CG10_big_fil_rev_8_21_14_0_10_32_14]|nr:MAG: hypothetical protein COU57_05835 [Candidatus Pacearchaeota archaeon CG10_big_fil_rev_8_21_14_0_10_32_14]